MLSVLYDGCSNCIRSNSTLRRLLRSFDIPLFKQQSYHPIIFYLVVLLFLGQLLLPVQVMVLVLLLLILELLLALLLQVFILLQHCQLGGYLLEVIRQTFFCEIIKKL